MHFIAMLALREMTNPIGGNGRTSINDEKNLHDVDYKSLPDGLRQGIVKNMSKGRILIVEDNMDNYQLVRYVLERAGYETFLAVNGRDGMDAARYQMPDLILMDLGLPEMDGWEAAEKIKADPETKSIPLIAITAHTLPRDRFRALQAGCEGYVTKPIHVESFLEVIDKTFEKLNRNASE